jgi:hypothetical protein
MQDRRRAARCETATGFVLFIDNYMTAGKTAKTDGWRNWQTLPSIWELAFENQYLQVRILPRPMVPDGIPANLPPCAGKHKHGLHF